MLKFLFILALFNLAFASGPFNDATETHQLDGTGLAWTKPYSQGGWDPSGSARYLSGSASLNVMANASYPNAWSIYTENNDEARVAYYGAPFMDFTSWINTAVYFKLYTTPDSSSQVSMYVQDINNNYHEMTVSLNGHPVGTFSWVIFYKNSFKNYINLSYVVMVRIRIKSDTPLSMQVPVIHSI